MTGQLDNFIKEMNEAMEGTIRTDEFGCRWRFHNGRWEAMCHVKPIPFPVKNRWRIKRMTDKIPVCIDFDGVLNEYEGWRGPNYLYAPRPGAREFLEILKEKGYRIIIFTTRKPLHNIREWFKKYQLPYDKITDRKLPAVAYIDDRALRFEGNYKKVLYELKNFKTHWEKEYYDGFTNPDFDEDDGLRFHLAYESDEGWWAVNDSGVTLWKEEVIYELNQLEDEKERVKRQCGKQQEEIECLSDEINNIHKIIQRAYQSERTDMGKNTIKQLAGQIGVNLNEDEKFIVKGPNMILPRVDIKPEILMGPVGRCNLEPIRIPNDDSKKIESPFKEALDTLRDK